MRIADNQELIERYQGLSEEIRKLKELLEERGLRAGVDYDASRT